MKIFLYLFIFFISLIDAHGQSSSLLDEIKQDSAIDLFIRQDWKQIEKKKKEKTYQPAEVKFVTTEHDIKTLPVQIRTRGNMRLQLCTLPPLKLKFEKSALSAQGLSPMNEMDLVQPCHEEKSYYQLILKEYLAYKLWELVSPNYFRTQLVRIHYTNPDESEAHDPSYAFLVENTEELVDRLDGRRNKTPVISSNAVDKQPLLLMALFQFMIGNTDWFIQNRHNVEFVGLPGYPLLVTVPYDFDYSGLVNAPYAVHHESIDLASVTSRYYQGRCITEEEVNDALKIFLEQKTNILNLPGRIQGLDEREVKETREYLGDFFDIIENPKKLESQVFKHCDMWPKK